VYVLCHHYHHHEKKVDESERERKRAKIGKNHDRFHAEKNR
jgi:hypothetical protein